MPGGSSLHGEVFNTLRRPHMVGSVRIGTPDDYVMRFLPAILSRFAEAYPLVQVEVHCDTSLNLLARNDLDLSIVTREPGTEIGQLLRQEPFVWMAAEGFCSPRPAADPAGHVQHHLLLPGLGLQRPGGGGTGLPHRLQQPQPVGAVRGGQRRPRRDRATAQPAHRQPAHPRRERGLPALPSASIMLMRNPHSQSPVTEKLAEYIGEGFRL